jgi:hypothetical protein
MLGRALAAQPSLDNRSSPEKVDNRALFVPASPGDGVGLLRRPGADYLCITNDGEAIFLPEGPYIFLRLIPKYARAPLGDIEAYRIGQADLRPMQSQRTSSWRVGRHESGTVAYIQNTEVARLALDAAELFMSGELWANDFYFLNPIREQMRARGFLFVPTGAIEDICVDTLQNFIAIAKNHLKTELPVQLKVGLVGTHNYRLAVDPRYFAFSEFEGRILRNAITYDAELASWPTSPFDALRPFFETIYDAAGIKRPDIK